MLYVQDNNFLIATRPLTRALAQLFEQLTVPARTRPWTLSERAKHEIARRYRAGEPVVAIAAIYGIRPQNVCRHAWVRGVPKRRPRRSKAWPSR